MAVYEPLGKDLSVLIREAPNHCLPINLIKKIAKHILLALQTLHSDEFKIVHTDIKPANIATCISQRSLFLQLDNIVQSKMSLQSLRMTFIRRSAYGIDTAKIRACFEKDLKDFSTSNTMEGEINKLNFKLLDFGNCHEIEVRFNF